MPFLGKTPSQIVDPEVDIDGGTIDGVSIGSVTANAGAFTNLTATGTLTLPDDGISGDDVNGGTISNFASTGIDDNAASTALTINSSGNVSIGTTGSAGVALTIGETTDTSTTENSITLQSSITGTSQFRKGLTFRVKEGIVTQDAADISFVSGASDAGAGNIIFRTSTVGSGANTERVRIDHEGNVGIKVSDPDEALEVGGDIKANQGQNAGVYHFGATSDQTKIVGRDNSHASFAGTMAFYTDGQQRIHISNTGRVGISEGDPDALLHLKSTAPDLILEDSDTGSAIGSSNRVRFRNGSGTFSAQIGNDPNINGGTNWTLGTLVNYGIGFVTNNSTQMVLDSSGRLCINKNAVTGNMSLEVQAPPTFSVGSGFYTDVTQSTIAFNDTNTGGEYHVRLGSEGNDMVFFAGNAKKAQLHDGGALDVYGPLGVPVLGSSTNSSLNVQNTAGGYGIAMSVEGTGKGYIQAQNFSSSTAYDLILQSAGSNVGVADSAPTTRLDVNGALRCSDQHTRHQAGGGLYTYWFLLYERHYRTPNAFDFDIADVLILGGGQTAGAAYSCRLLIGQKQQQASDSFNIYLYEDHANSFTNRVAYKYDSTGGNASNGLLQIWVQKPSNYMTLSAHVRRQIVGSENGSGVFQMVSTGSTTQPSGSTTISASSTA